MLAWAKMPYWVKERIPKRVESEICNLDELCDKSTCELYDAKKCFLAKARSRARDADLIIVNHAFALFDKMFAHVLPVEAKFIVFDEAHHLEDDATSVFEHVISEGLLQLFLQQLYGKRGVKNLINSIAQSKNNKKLVAMANEFNACENNIRIIIQSLFTHFLPQLVAEDKSGEFSSYCMFQDIPDSAGIKKSFIETVEELRARLVGITNLLIGFESEADSPRVKKTFWVRLEAIKRLVDSLNIVTKADKEYVRYLERTSTDIQIKAAPLFVAKQLNKYVYDNYLSMIFTSATLMINRNFQFFAERCGTSLIAKEKIKDHYLKSSSLLFQRNLQL